LFLIAGTLAALAWANLDPTTRNAGGQTTHGSYDRFVHYEPASLFSSGERPHPDEHESHMAPGGEEQADQIEHEHPITLYFLVNDVLMALFFAIAAKEVWESRLPGGPLADIRKALTPLFATAGGVIGPAAIYAGGALALGQWDALGRGWAVPCATDIAFSYLVARMIFGAGHPAISFLLLLAIADDAAGLAILAVFYPSGEVQLQWLLLTLGAMALGLVLHKTLRLHSFWWYLLIPGVLSWWSFYEAGIHPALGLVPIIPTMPHAHTDLGIFAREELGRHDTLNEFEHWWKRPVELILGLFGLVNAGVVLSSIGAGTWLVLAGLLIGKPVGITLLTWIAEKGFGLQISGGMNYRHIVTLGAVAGIGFTVALFVSTAAFPEPGPVQDSVKMGSLMSFAAAGLAFILAKVLRVKPTPTPQAPHELPITE
jgi:NhaA family Na+:H+ antiporter